MISSGTRWTWGLAVSVLLAGQGQAQTVLHVNAAAPPGGDGLSWVTAMSSLESALEAAALIPELSRDVEVWIAAGTYKPTNELTPGTPQTATFSMLNKVRVYGGFAGNETLLGERLPAVHVVTLSGDLAGDDLPNFSYGPDNAYHVVTADGVDATSVLDGVTISGGAAVASPFLNQRGGGMRVNASTCAVTGCTFRGNTSNRSSDMSGGAVYIFDGAPVFTGCVFDTNRCTNFGFGGAVASEGAATVMNQCAFTANRASVGNGGAIALSGGTLLLFECSFDGNLASVAGAVQNFAGDMLARRCTFASNVGGESTAGVVTSPGAASDFLGCTFSGHSSPAGPGAVSGGRNFVNCGFFGNGAVFGPGAVGGGELFVDCVFSGNSAVAFQGGSALNCNAALVRVVGCTFVENWSTSSAPQAAALRYSGVGSLAVDNSIFWRNSAGPLQRTDEATQVGSSGPGLAVNSCFVHGLTGSLGGTGNIGGGPNPDPGLVNLAGADGIIGTVDDDVRLSSCSPCIDAGSNTLLAADVLDLDNDLDLLEPTPFDHSGLGRRQDDPATPDTGAGTAPIVDIGAYEYQPADHAVWTAAAGGAYSNSGNWINGPTTVATSGAFKLASAYSVTVASDQSARSLEACAGAVTLQIAPGVVVTTGVAADYGLCVGAHPSAGASVLVNGGSLAATRSLVGDFGTLGGNGVVLGDVACVGTIAPGADAASTGKLEIDGSLAMTGPSTLNGFARSGRVRARIGGKGAGQFDSLSITGGASLGGLLDITLVGGFQPGPGVLNLPILTADARQGMFDVALMPALSDGRYLGVAYQTLRGTSEVAALTTATLPATIAFVGPKTRQVAGRPTAIAIGDLNGDGRPDLVIAVPNPANPTGLPGSIHILYNGGNGPSGWNGFDTSVEVPLDFGPSDQGMEPAGLALADFNQDLRVDIAVACASSHNVMVLQNTNNMGAFSLATSIGDVGEEPRAIVAGDIDQFEGIDLVVASAASDVVTALLGASPPAISFTAATPAATGRRPVSMCLLDADGDGDLDLIVGNEVDSSLTVLLKQSKPTLPYRTERRLPMAGPAVRLAAADIDGDGAPDVVVSDGTGNAVSVVLNRTVSLNTLEFAPRVDLPASGATSGLVITDLDKESDRDVVVLAGGQMRVLRNDLNSGEQLQFAPLAGLPMGAAPTLLGTADVDLNGLPDLIAVSDAAAPMNDVVVRRNISTLTCPADLDRNGAVEPLDIAVFVQIWLASIQNGTLMGDFDHSGVVDPQDISAYVTAWLSGAGGGC
ncbi:MAG: VCBS repeat-containing protein [Phycisphaeraceae bacterium]|nr:VCBS repeat-containing protein [Phycisphaeraceae bacterium]